jgi:hypothetical protein
MEIPHKYIARDYQRSFYNCLKKGFKRAVAIWHRRAGKDKTAFNLMVKEMLKRVGVYYYFFPTFAEGRRILWDGIGRDGMPFLDHFPEEIITDKNSTEMKIRIGNGSLFQIIGTDKFDRVRGPNPIGCIFSEYSQQDPRAWDVIRPILAENEGWALFLYTPMGKNHGYDLYEMAKKNPSWWHQLLTVADTKRDDGSPVISIEAIEEERMAGMSEDMIRQEFYCSFEYGVEGSYYGRLMSEAKQEGRIGVVPYDRAVPVHTSWDLGISDSMVIWWMQFVGQEKHWIDYYEASGEGISHYIDILQKRREERGFVYGEHFAPHDIEAREKATGKSMKEYAYDLGLDFVTVPRTPKIEAGIEAVRGVLPLSWFDEYHCESGIKSLMNYRKEYNAKHMMYSARPLHDWASHGADGLRTICEAMKLGLIGGKRMTVQEAHNLEARYSPPRQMF